MICDTFKYNEKIDQQSAKKKKNTKENIKSKDIIIYWEWFSLQYYISLGQCVLLLFVIF
jgi:hypothetical protein